MEIKVFVTQKLDFKWKKKLSGYNLGDHSKLSLKFRLVNSI